MANPGYSFVNWTGAAVDPTNPSTTVIMNQQQTVTANFAALGCVNNLAGRGTAGLFGKPDRIDLTWIGFGNATSYNVLRGVSAGGENLLFNGTREYFRTGQDLVPPHPKSAQRYDVGAVITSALVLSRD